MKMSWTGPLITAMIALGVGVVLFFNLQSPGSRVVRKPTSTPEVAEPQVPTGGAGAGQEKPIGDPVVENHIRVAAVYLSAVAMDGIDPGSVGGSELIHLEADIKATEDNPNGFAKDEFIPYLKVTYEIVSAQGGPAIEKGELTPMVAWDGLHYGANVSMPKVGDYKLVYEVQPPSVGGLGRHSDKTTGVAPWWKPFKTSFDWTVEPKTGSSSLSRN